MDEPLLKKHQRIAQEVSEMLHKEFPGIEDGFGINEAMPAFETGFNLAIPYCRVVIKLLPNPV